MQDADLFLELAGIAGVFVGFGALIAVRSGGPSDPFELAPMRAMVAMGMMTIVVALAPVTLARYGLAGHQLWAPSGAVALAAWLVMLAVNLRTPEYREGWAATVADEHARGLRVADIIGDGAYVLYMILSVLMPIVVILGLAPGLEAALYFTVVVLMLLGAAWTLLWLVYMDRRPASA